jgi:HPt (histidine-containing phosphotransfer) domain-containing protein
MDTNSDIPDLDLRSVQSVMKLGGKKKLDALIALIQESGPARLREIKEAQSLSEARAAAQALKTSAGNLGLARLEDLCDQLIASKSWAPGSPLIQQMELSYRAGHKALLEQRSKF